MSRITHSYASFPLGRHFSIYYLASIQSIDFSVLLSLSLCVCVCGCIYDLNTFIHTFLYVYMWCRSHGLNVGSAPPLKPFISNNSSPIPHLPHRTNHHHHHHLPLPPIPHKPRSLVMLRQLQKLKIMMIFLV